MAEKSVKVTLRADVANYVKGMQEAARSTDEVTKGSENIDEWGDRYGEALSNLGTTAMIAGAGIVAGLGLGAKAAMDWESAWTGVLKTVDATPAQLGRLEEGLRELTEVLPASHTEIAAVAEAAGQLGIATPNILAFTETMINLGETTNLTSEEAATSLAQFMNIMGTSQDQVENLGSALVGLGNNFATTERDILEMATRLAGAGAQVGMTEGEVLGLATSLSSVGIEAEAGGSAVSKVMIDIAAAVDEGGEAVSDFAAVAGVSGEEFARIWKEDAGEGLNLFIQGLANAEAQGKTTLGILADLGIKEVRMRDALLRAAQASDLFSDAMSMGNEEFEKNIALQEEAELRYGTTESKLGILRNRFTEMGIEIGTALLPAIEVFADGLGYIMDTITTLLDGPGGDLVAWGGLIVGAMLLAGGGMMNLIPRITETLAHMQTLGIETGAVTDRFKNLFTWKGALKGGAITLGIGAAIAGLAALVDWLGKTETSAEKAAAEILNAADAVQVINAALDADRTNWDKFWGGSNDRIQNILKNELPTALDVWTGRMEESAYDQKYYLDDIETGLKDIGEALGAMDPESAAKGFQFLADAYAQTDADLVELLKRMPEYAEMLELQTAGAGLVTGELDTYEEYLGLAQYALEQAAPAAGELTGELAEQEQAAADAAEEIDNLIKAIEGLDDIMSKFTNSELAYYEALEDINEALEANGRTVDKNTEAGRNNILELDNLAQKTNEYASGVFTLNQNQAEAAGILTLGKQTWIDQAEILGYTRERAEELANAYFGMPTEVFTDVTDGGAIALLNDDVDALAEELSELPPNTFVQVTGLTEEAKEKLEDLGYTVTTLPDGEVIVTANTDPAADAIDGLNGRVVAVQVVASANSIIAEALSIAGNYTGNLHEYANGGAVVHAGIPTGIYAGGANIHKFAEPETRWEAYISGKPGLEQRNIGIALEALKRLGYDRYEHYADGGVRDYMQYATQAQSVAPVVNVSAPAGGNTWNPVFNVNDSGMPVAAIEQVVRRVIRTEMGR